MSTGEVIVVVAVTSAVADGAMAMEGRGRGVWEGKAGEASVGSVTRVGRMCSGAAHGWWDARGGRKNGSIASLVVVVCVVSSR